MKRCSRLDADGADDPSEMLWAHPAERLDELLRYRGEHELPEGTAGVDDARGRAARLGRNALRRGADEHREAARAGADLRDQAQRDDESRSEPMKGVSAVPMARRTMPPISTGAGP